MRRLNQLFVLGLFSSFFTIALGQTPAYRFLSGCEGEERASLHFRPELMEAAFEELFTRTDSLVARSARLEASGLISEPWACGDALTYQTHTYATVAIGAQCWFQENLQAASYTNGEPIAGNLDAATWSTATYGAQAIYNLDSLSNFASSGRIYNWFAVADARGLCPSGWHVPTESDWQELELQMGMDAADVAIVGLRGTTEGAELKSAEGWNGTDAFGFKAMPVGRRTVTGGFTELGAGTVIWSSTLTGLYAYNRLISSDSEQLGKGQWNKLNGLSVRCLLDTEDQL